MIDGKLAQKEISTGLAAVCAWCEHYHNGKRNGMVGCGKEDECGGPLARRMFPLYKGPMENMLSSFCYICGGEPSGGIMIGSKVLGICDKMGPNGQTCMDKFKLILDGQRNVVVKEHVVPMVGQGTEQ